MTLDQGNFACMFSMALVALATAGCMSTADVAIAATPPSDPPASGEAKQAPPAMFLTAAPPAEEEEKTALLGLCAGSEETVFAGTVDDDFGLDLAVCVAPAAADTQAKLSVVWSGEGGTSRTSCPVSECSGIVEFTRYTRPRFTLLTLAWETNGQKHRIEEAFDADGNNPPLSEVKYSWQSPAMIAAGEDPLVDPVEVGTEPLALLRLDGLLDSEQ